jgi:hypothetical protein
VQRRLKIRPQRRGLTRGGPPAGQLVHHPPPGSGSNPSLSSAATGSGLGFAPPPCDALAAARSRGRARRETQPCAGTGPRCRGDNAQIAARGSGRPRRSGAGTPICCVTAALDHVSHVELLALAVPGQPLGARPAWKPGSVAGERRLPAATRTHEAVHGILLAISQRIESGALPALAHTAGGVILGDRALASPERCGSRRPVNRTPDALPSRRLADASPDARFRRTLLHKWLSAAIKPRRSHPLASQVGVLESAPAGERGDAAPLRREDAALAAAPRGCSTLDRLPAHSRIGRPASVSARVPETPAWGGYAGVSIGGRETLATDDQEASDPPAGSRLLSLPLRSSVACRTARPQIVRSERMRPDPGDARYSPGTRTRRGNDVRLARCRRR